MGSNDHDGKTSVSSKGGEFVGSVSDCCVLSEESDLWSHSVGSNCRFLRIRVMI